MIFSSSRVTIKLNYSGRKASSLVPSASDSERVDDKFRKLLVLVLWRLFGKWSNLSWRMLFLKKRERGARGSLSCFWSEREFLQHALRKVLLKKERLCWFLAVPEQVFMKLEAACWNNWKIVIYEKCYTKSNRALSKNMVGVKISLRSKASPKLYKRYQCSVQWKIECPFDLPKPHLKVT